MGRPNATYGIAALLIVAAACTDPAPPPVGANVGEPACPMPPITDETTVATTHGNVRGTSGADGFAFLGIPYGAAPSGANRFRPPDPPACWAGVRDATSYGPACPQLDIVTNRPTGSEDCLGLNVWTPTIHDGLRRPVLVFIHGGGDMIGAANQTLLVDNLYGGAGLARDNDVVVVSFNYRLGPLGFLAHPALAAADPNGASGNYGLYDAIAALQWVQANIERFGGDPNRVMVFGESAGAFNTCALVASPLATGLFSGALMESGNCSAPSQAARYADAENLVAKVGCGGLSDVAEVRACLEAAPAERYSEAAGSLLAMVPATGPIDPRAIGHLAFGPSVDGVVLPREPIEALRAGVHNHVPLVIGTNRDEFAIFSLVPGQYPLDCSAYQQRMRDNFGDLAPAVIERYPCSVFDPLSGPEAYRDVITDALFTCPSRRAALAAAAAQSEPVFRFLFTHRFDYGPMAALGAFHTAELPFVFDSFGALAYIATSRERNLAKRIQARWTSFARIGEPSAPGSTTWPRYDSGDLALGIDVTESIVSDYDRDGCQLWDSVQ
jgi:para-nitrobenzyl esterase